MKVSFGLRKDEDSPQNNTEHVESHAVVDALAADLEETCFG